jgi:hypothetical protein
VPVTDLIFRHALAGAKSGDRHPAFRAAMAQKVLSRPFPETPPAALSSGFCGLFGRSRLLPQQTRDCFVGALQFV